MRLYDVGRLRAEEEDYDDMDDDDDNPDENEGDFTSFYIYFLRNKYLDFTSFFKKFHMKACSLETMTTRKTMMALDWDQVIS